MEGARVREEGGRQSEEGGLHDARLRMTIWTMFACACMVFKCAHCAPLAAQCVYTYALHRIGRMSSTTLLPLAWREHQNTKTLELNTHRFLSNPFTLNSSTMRFAVSIPATFGKTKGRSSCMQAP